MNDEPKDVFEILEVESRRNAYRLWLIKHGAILEEPDDIHDLNPIRGGFHVGDDDYDVGIGFATGSERLGGWLFLRPCSDDWNYVPTRPLVVVKIPERATQESVIETLRDLANRIDRDGLDHYVKIQKTKEFFLI